MVELALGSLLPRLAPTFAHRDGTRVPAPTPLQIEAELGFALPAALRAWVTLGAEHDVFGRGVGSYTLCVPAAQGLAAMLATKDGHWVTRFLGFFCATSFVATANEGSHSATWGATPSGAVRVHSQHQDEDDEIAQSAPDLASLLWKLHTEKREEEEEGEEEDGEDEEEARSPFTPSEEKELSLGAKRAAKEAKNDRLPAHLDPEELMPRARLVASILSAVPIGEKAKLAKALPSLSVYEAEKELLAQWPHLAAFWLWAHALVGNVEEFQDVASRTRALPHPAVTESREVLERWLAGEAACLGKATLDSFVGLQEEFRELAPKAALAPAALAAKRSDQAAVKARAKAIQAALAALAAGGDARGASLLEAHLDTNDFRLDRFLRADEQLRARPLATNDGRAKIARQCEIDLAAYEGFAELVDVVTPALRPVLRDLVRAQSRRPDDHKTVRSGFIYLLGKSASSFADLKEDIPGVAREAWGIRRQCEWIATVGLFSTPDAIAFVRDEAAAWVARGRERDDVVGTYWFDLLLKRDTREAAEVSAALFDRDSFDGQIWSSAMSAARRVPTLTHRAICAPALRRALAAGLGNVQRGERRDVVAAIVAAEGNGCLEFLCDAYAPLRAKANERYEQAALGPLLWGLLLCTPVAPEVLADVRWLAEGRLAQVEADLDDVTLVATLVRGICRGRVDALNDLVERAAVWDFKPTSYNEVTPAQFHAFVARERSG